jgi:hypothetical protein
MMQANITFAAVVEGIGFQRSDAMRNLRLNIR